MANPFGELIDDEKLEGMARYNGKWKSQEDRAREAKRVRAGVAHDQAREYVDGLQRSFGDDGTLCMIHNATGETLYFVDGASFDSYLGRTPYPTEIGNGQWVSFFQAHAALLGSDGAVMYLGKQKDGYRRKFILSWSTPSSYSIFRNKAYCEMREEAESVNWYEIHERTRDSGYYDKVDRDGMFIETSTATGDRPVFTALLTIPVSI